MIFRRRKNRIVTLTAAVGIAATTLVSCGGHHVKPAAAPTTSSSTTTTTKPKPKPVKKAATCPLTGQLAPGGKVPQRPALAVKIENLPQARPQYGLAQADVVYEEPVEGGLTRFIAIYQCQEAARLEPIRSGRLIDPWIIMQYGAHPLLAYAGAISWVVSEIDSSSLIDVGIDHGQGYWRDPARYAPHNLVNSTQNLWTSGYSIHHQTTPPGRVFSYGPVPAGATHAASLTLGYQVSQTTWTWNPKHGVYARSYSDTGPAALGDGGQIMAANIVVMHVVEYPTPYVEDATGAHENALVLTGHGQAEIFRNGAEISGYWERGNLNQLTRYVTAKGKVIPLTPGNTWVELLPTGLPLTVTP